MEPADATTALIESNQAYSVKPHSLTEPIKLRMRMPSTHTGHTTRFAFEVIGATKATYTFFKNGKTPQDPANLVETGEHSFKNPNKLNPVDVTFHPSVKADFIEVSFLPESLGRPVEVSQFFAVGCFDHGNHIETVTL